MPVVALLACRNVRESDAPLPKGLLERLCIKEMECWRHEIIEKRMDLIY